MPTPLFPKRIVTPRLVVRCYEPGDASLLKDALDSSLDHLLPWLPWAHDEPSTLDVLEARLAKFHAEFEARINCIYGIFASDESQLLGGTGLHPFGAADEIEIGYWLRASAVGHGYASEGARALTEVAFSAPEISTVIIKCDPKNTRSACVPKRVGFTLKGLAPTSTTLPDRSHDMVWVMTRKRFSGL